MPSELQVNTITEATSGSGITFAKDIIPATPLSHRNMIINGDMRVAQRSTAMLTVSDNSNEGYSTIDRFWTGMNNSVSGAISFGRDTDAPDGFSRSLKMQCSTANTSLSGTDAVFVATTIEAQDLQRLGYGSSGAKTSTLSFYAKRAGTDWGKISVSFNKDDSPEEWFVPEATTLTTSWARYSVTIPANTTNAIADDNGAGVKVRFYVAGPTDATYDGATDTAWGTSRKDHHNDLGNLLSHTSNIFYLTGVQWELGSIATPFEHRSYSDELARCQRYFYAMHKVNQGSQYIFTGYFWANGSGLGNYQPPVTMRANPTVISPNVSNSLVFYVAGSSNSFDYVTINGASPQNVNLTMQGEGSGTAGHAGGVAAAGNSTYMYLTAEL